MPRLGKQDPPLQQGPDLVEELRKLHDFFESFKINHTGQMEVAQRIQAMLDEQAGALQTSKNKFASTKVKVEGALDKFKGRVKLNVGGCKYETTLTTLAADGDNSMLGTMFSGRHDLRPDEDGAVFVDRDGTHFGAILNMLRDTKVEVNLKDRTAFEAELAYYGVSKDRMQRSVRYVDANKLGTAYCYDSNGNLARDDYPPPRRGGGWPEDWAN